MYSISLTKKKQVIFFVFNQEKLAKISSVKSKKSKASVVAIHVSGLCRVFNDLLKDDDNGTMD